ncbi:hypothetical protein EON65_51665, partial [archaeon]
MVSGDSSAGKLTAAISSFGYSGTISHAVLSAGTITTEAVVDQKFRLATRGVTKTMVGASKLVFKAFAQVLQHQIAYNEQRDHFTGHCYVNNGILHRWLNDHRLLGRVVFPGAGMIELALEGAIGKFYCSMLSKTSSNIQASAHLHSIEIRGFTINAMLEVEVVALENDKSSKALPKDYSVKVVGRPVVDTVIDTEDTVIVESFFDEADNIGTLHAQGFIHYDIRDDDSGLRIEGSSTAAWSAAKVPRRSDTDALLDSLAEDLVDMKTGCIEEVNVSLIYQLFWHYGLQYGPNFQLIKSCVRSNDACVCQLDCMTSNSSGTFVLAPSLLDCVLQSSLAVLMDLPGADKDTSDQRSHATYVPYSFDRVCVHLAESRAVSASITCESILCLRRKEDHMIVFDCLIRLEDGRVLAVIEGAHCRAIQDKQLATAAKLSHQDIAHPCVTIRSAWEHSEQLQLVIPAEQLGPYNVCILGDGSLSRTLASAISAIGGTVGSRLSFSNALISSTPAELFDVVLICMDELISSVYDVNNADSISPSHKLIESSLRVMETACKLSGRILFLSTNTGEEVDVHVDLDSRHGSNNKVCLSLLKLLCAKFNRTFSLEYPMVGISAVFVESMDQDLVVDFLSTVLLREIKFIVNGAATNVKYVDGARMVQTLKPVFYVFAELTFSSRGDLDNLLLNTTNKPFVDLLPLAILLETSSVALNFRDVLNVLGMYPGDPGDPGCEFAGKVVAVGSDVTKYKVGDEVV